MASYLSDDELYERCRDQFIDEYLEKHPDATEFEAALCFDVAPEQYVVTMYSHEVDRVWQRKQDEML